MSRIRVNGPWFCAVLCETLEGKPLLTILRMHIHLDAIGTLPTPAEVRAFLADKSADKRNKAIERNRGPPLQSAGGRLPPASRCGAR